MGHVAHTGLYRMDFKGMREWAERAPHPRRGRTGSGQPALCARRRQSVCPPLAEAMSQRAAAAVALPRGNAGIAADRVLASMAAAEEIRRSRRRVHRTNARGTGACGHPYRRIRPHNADGVGVETLPKREIEIAHLVKNRDTIDVTSRVEVARTVERADAPRLRRSQTDPDG